MTFFKKLDLPQRGFSIWVPGGHIMFFLWGIGFRCMNFNILVWEEQQ